MFGWSRREIMMNKTVSPVKAGKRVLRAFPYPKIGAEISREHIEDHFRRRSLPTSELLLGLRYATQVGWIRAGELQSFVLLEAGMDEVAKPPVIPAVPASVWHAWAHE
jgi:hypothetical protein